MTALAKRQLPYDWKVVKAAMQDRMGQLVDRYGWGRERPDSAGRIWPLNPWRGDRRPGSFNVATREHPRFDVGAWHDFSTRQGGDIFDLVARFERHADKMSTYWWCLEFLGWGRGEVRTKAQADQDRERELADRLAREAKASEDASAERQKLKKRWLDCRDLKGSLGEVYIRGGRGIDLSRLPKMPDAIRFSPAWDHVDEDGVVTTWPALVTAMTRLSKLAGLHITWLAANGMGKAPVTPAKKMRGSVSGAAIRLTRGTGGLSPAEALKRGHAIPLMLGEGIETTLTCAAAQPGYRAWAAGSLSLMRLIEEWPEYASAMILLRDNDWGKAAREEFDRVVAHWEALARGRPLKVAGARVGNDFNDWVRA